MGLNDFILNCEKDNKELRKNIEYYKNKNQRLEQENQQLKEHLHQKEDIIDKVIKWIENDYYSMNTIDIDSIVITNNKLLLIRRFLKGER